MTQPSTSRRTVVNYVGIAILLIGMSVGEFIYWRSLQGKETDDEDPLLWQHSTHAYERGLATYTGTFGVLMDRWTRAAATLGEPKPLAITIAVFSMVTAGGCFIVASRMPRG